MQRKLSSLCCSGDEPFVEAAQTGQFALHRRQSPISYNIFIQAKSAVIAPACSEAARLHKSQGAVSRSVVASFFQRPSHEIHYYLVNAIAGERELLIHLVNAAILVVTQSPSRGRVKRGSRRAVFSV